MEISATGIQSRCFIAIGYLVDMSLEHWSIIIRLNLHQKIILRSSICKFDLF